MNTVEVNKMLNLSTAYITEKTNDFIIKEDIPTFQSEYGFVIHVGMVNADCPQDLQNCINIAKKNGCEYLILDRDGGACGLQT